MASDTQEAEALDAAGLAELLAFPARCLTELPLGVRFELQLVGFPEVIVVNTSPVTDQHEQGVAWDPDELLALVAGTEAERLWPSDLRGLCLRKRGDPDFKLTLDEALAGAQPERCAPHSLGRVLSALDLRLVRASLRPPATATGGDASPDARAA